MEAFREAVDVCGLADLGFEGRMWTYEKKIAGGAFCRVRLDRALATTDWSMRYPLAKVRHLTAAASDHGPITLTWRSDEPRNTRKKNFKYEVMWETHEDFSPTLAEAWG
jgi:endonuclease/exonuclease/phosphatase family metal-dependent hydrolase